MKNQTWVLMLALSRRINERGAASESTVAESRAWESLLDQLAHG